MVGVVVVVVVVVAVVVARGTHHHKMSRLGPAAYSPVAMEGGLEHAAEAGLLVNEKEGASHNAHQTGKHSVVVADYSYPPSNNRAWRCCGGRLVGRINVMLEVPIRDGEEHPKYPGLRTRIVCVIPSGWPMLFVTFGLVIVVPVVIFCVLNNDAVAYGAPFVTLSMIVTAVSLARTTFKDPGIFPRYSVPQAGDWHVCQKTQSYR